LLIFITTSLPVFHHNPDNYSFSFGHTFYEPHSSPKYYEFRDKTKERGRNDYTNNVTSHIHFATEVVQMSHCPYNTSYNYQFYANAHLCHTKCSQAVVSGTFTGKAKTYWLQPKDRTCSSIGADLWKQRRMSTRCVRQTHNSITQLSSVHISKYVNRHLDGMNDTFTELWWVNVMEQSTLGLGE
jgi:hypothetical protein